MSKIITSIVLAVVCASVMSFLVGMNPSITVTPQTAGIVGAVVGLLLG